MKAVSLPSGQHNGLLAQYNLCTEPDQGIGMAALRRILCSCESCTDQLERPWQKGASPNLQERYTRNENCKFWPLFEGLNDWVIVSLIPTKNADLEELQEAQAVVLEGIATMMAE